MSSPFSGNCCNKFSRAGIASTDKTGSRTLSPWRGSKSFGCEDVKGASPSAGSCLLKAAPLWSPGDDKPRGCISESRRMLFLDLKARKGHTDPQGTKQAQIWIIWHRQINEVAFSKQPCCVLSSRAYQSILVYVGHPPVIIFSHHSPVPLHSLTLQRPFSLCNSCGHSQKSHLSIFIFSSPLTQPKQVTS